ncbi:MAG TPA: RimK family alpha-L-glutamate ligase [Gemmatimonadaceae bacterium]|jgi:RimK family alpha-L-glutamate ligase|nr:RimK family alpha-L-glutamate ligase [Gemmatimonadaceae bacterium]
MFVAILAARTGWHTDELTRAFAARGARAAVFPYESLVASLGRRAHLAANDTDLLDADAVLARIIPNGSLEQIVFRVDALHALEDAGIPVMNPPRAIERTVDKFYTSALLARAGLATPDTVVCERADDAMTAFRDMRDVIVKPLVGSMGLGMVRVSDEEIAWRVFRSLEAIHGVYYLQRTIEHDGRDVRVFVVGDRVLGAIERSAAGWRTNLARGGRARAITLPAEWHAMALCAARTVGAAYAGVDLLPARDGSVYVLEVNGIPGWHGLQTATSFDVAQAIVDHLLDAYRVQR